MDSYEKLKYLAILLNIVLCASFHSHTARSVFCKKIKIVTLAGVAKLVGHCPMNQRAVGSIPGQGRSPGLWA